MSADAATILAGTTLVVRHGPFRLGAWPHAQRDVVSAAVAGIEGRTAVLIADDRELSALLPSPEFAALPSPTSVTDDFALLTLDAVMPWDVLGVLALVTGALAAAEVPAGAFAAFSRDHLIVPAGALDAALHALRPLVAGVSVADG